MYDYIIMGSCCLICCRETLTSESVLQGTACPWVRLSTRLTSCSSAIPPSDHLIEEVESESAVTLLCPMCPMATPLPLPNASKDSLPIISIIPSPSHLHLHLLTLPPLSIHHHHHQGPSSCLHSPICLLPSACPPTSGSAL